MSRFVFVVVAVFAALLPAACGGGTGDHPAAAQTPVLNAGEERTFPAGELAVGSTIACVSGGVRTEARVPPDGNTSNSDYAWNKSGGKLAIQISLLPNGAVRAGCD